MSDPFVGYKKWSHSIQNETCVVNYLLTTSDEAFLMLCCENYYERWLSIAEKNVKP